MKMLPVAVSAAFLAAASIPASAVTLSFGASLTSDYIARGLSQTGNNPALQPWIEAEMNGWYGGLWASNVSFAPDGLELDVYGGYRWSVESTSFDVGYARYFYDSTGDAGGEFYLLMEHELANEVVLSGGAYLGHAGSLTVNDVHAGISMPLFAGLTGSVRLGVTPGSFFYGDIGVGYDVSENVSIDVRYHQSTGQSGRVVVTAGLSF